MKASEIGGMEEESLDTFPSSIDQSFNETSSYQGELSQEQTPASGRKRKKVWQTAFSKTLFESVG